MSGMIVGFAVTFVAMTTLVAATLAVLGISGSLLRTAAVVALGLVGVTLAVPAIESRVARILPGWGVPGMPVLADGAGAGPAPRRGGGFVSGLLIGGAIGLIWAPCVGPLMAVVITTAAVAGPTPEGVAIATAYVLGAAIPLAAIAFWGRRLTRRVDARTADGLRRGFGVAMIVASVLVLTGLDVPLQAGLTASLPAGWGVALTGSGSGDEPTTAASAVPPLNGVHLTAADLPDLGPAPELTGIEDWINGSPLTLASLRGKVVLVHFWTFGCSNCIHVQPYVKRWYDTYEKDGFVVIGVHSPEFSFERDVDNVRAAVASADVRFPVATDPTFATWNAFGNKYWPGFYFIDRTGHIRSRSAGEGDYDVREAIIQALLAEG